MKRKQILSAIFLILLSVDIQAQTPDYSVNYPDGSTNSRRVTSIQIGNQIHTLDSKDYYVDLCQKTFTVNPGESLTCQFNRPSNDSWKWMHGYLYIDIDHNGFTGGISADLHTPTGDLVAFSCYDEDATDKSQHYVNSTGAAASPEFDLNPPTFQAPSTPGTYRMRWKVDWNNIDPKGALPDAYGKNSLKINNGTIIDVMLEVTGNGGGTSSEIIELPTEGSNGARIIPLSSLEISKATCGWGTIQADKSIGVNPIRLCGKTYRSGVGTHAPSQIIVKLNGAVNRFATYLGIDEEIKSDSQLTSDGGIVDYRISAQGSDNILEPLKEGTIRITDGAPVFIEVDCKDWKYLYLEVFEGQGQDAWDHVDWANAYFEFNDRSTAPPVIVTEAELSNTLDCATEMFTQPSVRYMHKLRASNPDATLRVTDLPEGLEWNPRRQLVEGMIADEGDYHYTIHLDVDGTSEATDVTLHVSSDLQQPVPFMGWLSWNVVEGNISEEVVRTTADAMVSNGLLKAGYNYLVIDDIWHAPSREAGTGNPLPDPVKFPNGMKVCADYVHSKGLKFGIYSDAAELTCAKCYGSYGYETIDANQYAAWDVDLLKYDYCFAPTDQPTALKRYKAMGDALKASGRDILFYMCEWGQREPWKWGQLTGATCWRCTYDTRDGWNGQSNSWGVGIGILQSIRDMKHLWPYSGPNRFNDADMMCVGIHGTGKSSSDLVDHAGMTQDEYRTQFSLWCMWSSPLTLSFDLRKPISTDDLSIMTHEELIALNQDRMGQQAQFISEADEMVVFAKDLENGDIALSVTNLSSSEKPFTFDFSQISALDPTADYMVRDLWAKEDLGIHQGSLETSVVSHGTRVFRLSRKTGTGLSANLSNDQFCVSADADHILISTDPANLQTKRILLSDILGHVVATATGTDHRFALPVPSEQGVYIVNVISCGHSRSVKVTI